jgi:hypothetical protein
MTKDGVPQSKGYLTMKKKMVHHLPIPLTYAAFIHHNNMLLPEIIQG